MSDPAIDPDAAAEAVESVEALAEAAEAAAEVEDAMQNQGAAP